MIDEILVVQLKHIEIDEEVVLDLLILRETHLSRYWVRNITVAAAL